jgi:hypothetical protein
MRYFNNRHYYKSEQIDDRIIKIYNIKPNTNELYFVLGSFNSTKETRNFVENSNELYTYILPEFPFYEKNDFIFSDDLLDVYKQLYKRIIMKLTISKHLNTDSLIMYVLYFYTLYLLRKENYLTQYENFENDYYQIIASNDLAKIKHLTIFESVRSKEGIISYFTELNKSLIETDNAQSIDQVLDIFQKQVKSLRSYR